MRERESFYGDFMSFADFAAICIVINQAADASHCIRRRTRFEGLTLRAEAAVIAA